MRNKLMNKNVLNKYRTNIIKLFFAFIILVAVSSRSTFAQAPDAFYDWASGYKFRTNPNNDGTMDKENFFKNVMLEPDTWDFSKYVNMMAKFPVSQENWTPSYPACRSGHLGAGDCTSDKQTVFGNVTFKYTCTGDVFYVMQDDNSSKDLVGGDTMYGTWSMLFNYFAPGEPADCGVDERPFVGNAFIIDTKAQKEANAGLYPGLGLKELVESPGEVYYFDQLREMTQPPGQSDASYNNMVLVGDAVPGMESLTGCDPALFEKLFGGNESPNYNTVTAEAKKMFKDEVEPLLRQYPELLKAYGAGQDASGNKVPCEILAGIHYNECGNQPNCSLWAGDGGFVKEDGSPGGTLRSDAIYTATNLVRLLGGGKTFRDFVGALTEHNGTGNLNCNESLIKNEVTYACYTPPTPIPTRWRLGGKCDPKYPYEDSPYALSWVDSRHADMDLIVRDNFVDCSSLFIPPQPKLGPGAFAIAYILHEYLKGAASATSCVSQY